MRAIPFLLLFSCTPSLPEAQNDAAYVYCDRALECGWTSESDYNDCIDLAEDFFDALWPDDSCDLIDRGEYHECLDRIDVLDCDDYDAGVTDLLSGCEANDVCED